MNNFTRMKAGIHLCTIFLLVCFQLSCKKNTFNIINQDRALPWIELSTRGNKIEAFQGQTVREIIFMNAQAGVSSIEIFVDGELQEIIDGVSGKVGYEYNIQYQVEDDMPIGSEVLYRFVLTDRQKRSIEESFSIKIVEAPPVPDFEFEDVVVGGHPYKLINLDINTDITLSKDHDYLLRGHIAIIQGSTLTIEEGTTIYAEPNASLLVSTGTRILAEGSKDMPIRFTSIRERNATASRGDWVGLFVHGRAPVTANHPSIMRIYGEYGGKDEQDNSGVLKYVEIAYAGGEADPEISNATSRALTNGALSLNAVGNATLLEYIYVNNAGLSRTGISIAGGTALLKYVFVNNPEGRGLLTKAGYKGAIQFLTIIYQEPLSDSFTAIDIYGTAEGATPIFSNVSINGGGVTNTRGIRIRNASAGANSPYTEGGRAEIYNTWITNTGNPGLRTDNVDGVTFAYGRIFDVATAFHSSATAFNRSSSPFFNSTDAVRITDVYKGVEFSGSLNPNTLNDWFDDASYIGAVDPNRDWTEGWISIP